MTKKYSILISVLFLLFIFGIGTACLLAPDRAFSEQENRYLAERPDFSADRFFSGEFSEDTETYISDQFFLRDNWVSLKAWSERLLGKHENGDIFFCENGTLIPRMPEPDTDHLAASIGYINDLNAAVDVPVYFALIPTASEIWSEKLPANADTADQAGLIQQLYAAFEGNTIDMQAVLHAHRDEAIFYRTDHHWTTLGAYYGYCALLEALELPPVPLSQFTAATVTESFYGTSYSASGATWISPDSIQTYVPAREAVRVTSYFTGTAEPGSLYCEEYLDKKDKYSYFLGGVQPLCVITSDAAAGGKLLIIRDSYTDTLAPYLTNHFSEVHLIDPRYYKDSIQSYISENGIDNVLVMYSVPNFASDTNLFVLAR